MDAIYMALGVMPTVRTAQNGANLPGDTAQSADSDFQKLLEQAQSADSGKPKPADKESPKQETTTTTRKPEKPATQTKKQGEEEAAAQAAGQMQVYLVPLTQEELSQIPAELLPANLEEGEAVFCIGMRTGEDGQQVPILVGANEAAQRFGRQVIEPETQLQNAAEAPEQPAETPEVQPMQHTQVRQDQTAQQGEQQEDSGEEKVEVTDAEAAPQPVFRDVESAPVKVGEAPAAESSRPADDLDSQIGPQLVQALEQGESRVELQLTPESLGSVKVEIVHSQDGTLHVALTAQNPQTRDLLEKHAEGLQSMLSARTQDQVRVQVQHQEESQRQDNHPYDGHNGQNHPQQQHRQHTPQSSQDFLDQLRLGLIPTDLT